MSDLELLSSEDSRFVGNWHPFPPPDTGWYDLRQAVPGPERDPHQYFFFFPNKRVYLAGGKRLQVMNRRVSRLRPQDGWQFRFQPERSTRYRPFAVIYDLSAPFTSLSGGPPRILRKDDVSQQLPIAVSREEALYIVRSMPDRWPIFRQIHVEYTPEELVPCPTT